MTMYQQTYISADADINGKLERWSPSVPVPTVLPTTVRPVDGTSESESSSSDTEDRDPLVLAPERPWSPSVPAALSTQTSRRRNTRTRKAEQPDNANGTSHTQPGLSTEHLPQPSSPTSAPPTPPSLSKTGLPTGPKSKVTNPFISGGLLTDFVGQPSSPPVLDGDHKIETLPEKISSSPSTIPRFVRPDTLLPTPRPSIEVPPSPSSPAHPPSPRLRRDRSPSRLSPASSRGSFSHGPLESSFTSVPSHPSSPNLSMRRSQGTSWPPFRPLASLGDGSAEFDPPFRAGPDFGELPQPPPFRPTSGATTARGFTPPHAPTHGRPTVISSSNAIPIAPRHSFVLPSAPGRSSSPAAQSLRNSQPLGSPTISPQPPRRPSHGMILDSGHPPRQPRSDAAMQAMASASLGQINPRSHNQYHRHQRHPHASRPLADGRGRGISMSAGAKRKASPPRTEPSVLLETPPKRPPPSAWPTASPIRCAAVQGERVAIRGIRFNRTGKLMAVTCGYQFLSSISEDTIIQDPY
ncbi:hypothetical protein BJV78DRAFT_131078 [Lactifluus subvellereus]|nr:hypothetical protein BJV78DRAFT_131078 [Lactifluus subvellereus]